MTKFPSYYNKTDKQVCLANKLLMDLKPVLPIRFLMCIVTHEDAPHVLIEDPLHNRSWRIRWHHSVQSTITKLLDPT